MVDLLAHPQSYHFDGRVAIIGGGATAVDCAITAKQRGAKDVELFMLEKLSEMPLTARERKELLDFDIEVNGRVRINKIIKKGKTISGVETIKVELPEGKVFSPANVRNIPKSENIRTGFGAIVVAIGMRSELKQEQVEGLFYAGDILPVRKPLFRQLLPVKTLLLKSTLISRVKINPLLINRPNPTMFCLASTVCQFRWKLNSLDTQSSPHILSLPLLPPTGWNK